MPKPSVVFHFIVFPFAFPMPLGSVSFSRHSVPIGELQSANSSHSKLGGNGSSLYMEKTVPIHNYVAKRKQQGV